MKKFFKFYNKYILPRVLDFGMRRKDFQKMRKDFFGRAVNEAFYGAPQENLKVLEIGFGSGCNLPYYKNVEILYALEPSKEMYAQAVKRIKKVNFKVEHLQASAENIPIEDQSVDLAISTWTMCSISDTKKALAEIQRVLKPYGKFVFIEHGKSANSFIYKVQKFLTPTTKHFTGGCHLDRDIEKIITASGFKIEKLEKFQLTKNSLAPIYSGVASLV